MRSSSFSRNHPYAKTRGWVSPTRAASALPTVTDGVNEVDDASELWIAGGTVDEPEEGVARISFGGQSIGSNSGTGSSAALPIRMFNSSGLTLIPGDVVVTDPNVDSGVTTTSTASNTRIVGVVQEPIDVASFGKVLFNGFASVVNTTGTVARGDYALTSATAKLAAATDDRVAGSFAVYLTGTDLPDFVTAQRTTEQDTQTTTFEVDMPPVPAGRVLFLAVWLESGTSSVTVSGWTRIGAESGFYYFYKTSEGDDTATPTWTGASVAVATVLLLHESVFIADIVESHDYDTSTSSAAVSGMTTTPARYAIAGVDKAVTPGSGFTRLGGGTAGAAAAGGTPALVQSVDGFMGSGAAPNVTFASTITQGNVMISVPFTTNTTDTYSTDPRQGGACPQDANMTEFGVIDTGLFGSSGRNAIAMLGKAITSDTYSGPFGSPSQCSSNETALFLMEFSNINVSEYEVVTDNGPHTGAVNLGTFAGVGANDLVILAIGWKGDGYGGSPDPTISVNGFTQARDAYSIANGWMWVGYKVGNGDASITYGNAIGDWAAVAVHLTQGATSAAGTLAGKYIGRDVAVTSPFTGAGAQNDAIFAINLSQDAKASALLYGPDLGAGGSSLSLGSNSTDVYPTSGLGADTTYSPSSHHHRGVRQISHASNTFVGDLTLTASGTLGITMPTPGTINLSAGTGGAGGGWTNVAPLEYVLGADVALTNANQFYDGPSGTPAAGTYDIFAIIENEANVANTDSFVIRLYSGATVIDEREMGVTPNSSATQGVVGSLMKMGLTLDGSTAVKIAAASLRGGGTMKRNPSRGSSSLHRATVISLRRVS